MGECSGALPGLLRCPCANSSRERTEPSLDQQRRQPAAFAQLAALCIPSHDKLPPGFYWAAICSLPPSSSCSNKGRYLSFIEMLATATRLDEQVLSASATRRSAAVLLYVCMLQGRQPIQHDRCFENWRSPDKLWYARPVACLYPRPRVKHGRAGSGYGHTTGIWGALMLSIALQPSHQQQHRGLCVLGVLRAVETNQSRCVQPRANDCRLPCCVVCCRPPGLDSSMAGAQSRSKLASAP